MAVRTAISRALVVARDISSVATFAQAMSSSRSTAAVKSMSGWLYWARSSECPVRAGVSCTVGATPACGFNDAPWPSQFA